MDGPTLTLLQYGLAGVVIFGETVAIVYQYRDKRRDQDKHDAERDRLLAKIDALMEARRLDAKEVLEKVTVPLSAISQTTSYIYDKLVASKARKS